MWKARSYQGLGQAIKDFPKYRWIFLTLTVRNCSLKNLRQTTKDMNAGFARLSGRTQFSAVKGWIKTLEVTASYDCYQGGKYLGRHGSTWVKKYQLENKVEVDTRITDEVHPHFHVLLFVQASYFTDKYVSQAKWIEMWQSCLRVDYPPSVNIQAVKHPDPLKIIPEILKYQTKESDLAADPYWLAELTRQMHKTKCISIGGNLRQYFRESDEETEDLIGESDEQLASEASLYFQWSRCIKKYTLDLNNE